MKKRYFLLAALPLCVLGSINAKAQTGNLGIGTSTPTAKLHVAGTVRIDSNVGIGTNAPTAKLHVNGDVRIVDVPAATTPSSVTPMGVDADGNVVKGYFAAGTTNTIDAGSATSSSGQTNSYNASAAWSLVSGGANVVVTFTTPAANANYQVVYSLEGNGADMKAPYITAKSASGFTIRLTESSSTVQAVKVDYTVFMRQRVGFFFTQTIQPS